MRTNPPFYADRPGCSKSPQVTAVVSPGTRRLPDVRPTPAMSMAAGIGVLGLSGFAYLAMAGHGRFSPADTAALSVTYLCTNVLGPGIFVAIEQETNRRVSRALAAPDRFAAQLRRLALTAAGIAGITMAVLLATGGWLVPRLLGGHVGLLLALVIGAAGSAAVYFVRGVCAGSGRLPRYGATLLVDGGLRIIGILLVPITGSVSGLGLALGIAPGLAALICGFGLPIGLARTEPDPSGTAGTAGRRGGSADRIAGTTAVLVASWLLILGMANLGGVVAQALSTDAARVAAFTAAVALTRIPVMLFGPIQAVLLPRLTAAATTDDRAAFHAQVTRAAAAVAAIGVVTVAGMALLGGWAVRLLFGVPAPGSGLAAWLGLGAALLLGMQLLQPAVLALGRHHAVLIGCALGLLVFAGCFLLPGDVFVRAALAQSAGPAVTIAAFAFALRRPRPLASAPIGPARSGPA